LAVKRYYGSEIADHMLGGPKKAPNMVSESRKGGKKIVDPLDKKAEDYDLF
jgi:hypothetical protein